MSREESKSAPVQPVSNEHDHEPDDDPGADPGVDPAITTRPNFMSGYTLNRAKHRGHSLREIVSAKIVADAISQ